MDDQILKTLKEFKNTRPDDGFVRHSRNMILNASRNHGAFRPSLFENLKLIGALALGSALMFAIITGLPYLGGIGSGGLAKQDAKLQSSDFYIQLGEVTYDLNEDKELGVEIEKLIKDKHL